MIVRSILTIASTTALVYAPSPSALGAECAAAAISSGQEFIAGAQCVDDGKEQPSSSGDAGSISNDGPVRVTYPNRCNDDGSCIRNDNLCSDPDDVYAIVWALADNGTWFVIRQGCFDRDSLPSDLPPTITDGMVLEALRRIGLPELHVQTDPSDMTLVNLRTVFFTSPEPVTRTLTLLGQSVEVEATPATYLWHFGDGESVSTDRPGSPYPAMDLTHRYAEATQNVQPSVDTTYTARFRVNGGPWQDVNGTVTIVGPPTSLAVLEATPVLSGNR